MCLPAIFPVQFCMIFVSANTGPVQFLKVRSFVGGGGGGGGGWGGGGYQACVAVCLLFDSMKFSTSNGRRNGSKASV